MKGIYIVSLIINKSYILTLLLPLIGILCIITAAFIVFRQKRELNKVQEQFRDNINMFYQLLGGLDSVVLVSDPYTDEVLFYNESADRLFELDGTGIGEPCWKVFRRQKQHCSFCKKEILLENPNEIMVWEDYEEQFDKYYRHIGKIVSWPDGRMVHLQESIDITDIKNTEMDVQKRYKQQELMTEITKIFISHRDIDRSIKKALDIAGRFADTDRLMLALWDDEKKEFMLQSHWERINSGYDPEVFSMVWQELSVIYEDAFISKQQRYIRKYSISKQDYPETVRGNVKALLSVPIYIDNKLIGVLSFMQEQERVWIESEIQLAVLVGNIFGGVLNNIDVEERLERMSILIENSPCIFAFLNEELDVEYVNPMVFEVFGYTIEELEQSEYSIFFEKEVYAYLTTEVFPMVYEGKEFNLDVIGKKKDGERRIFDFKVFPVPDKGGKKGVAIIAIDVTERRELEAELSLAKDEAVRASQAKGNFLSNMSHEIRTPMTAIMGLLDISLQSGDIEHIKACLAKMKTSSLHLLNLLNDVLDMSKIESGNLELADDSFHLEQMLLDLMVSVGVRAQEKEQEILIDIEDEVPRQLFGDSMRLSQIIMNLLSNAIKFSSYGKKISLSIRCKEKKDKRTLLEFSVADEGVGVEKDKLSNIFIPFRQADGSITKRFGGTGLGLAISKAIVEKMGGHIYAESEEGKGSSFTFTACFKVLEDRVRKGCDNSPNSVLIVDESEQVRNHIARIFKKHEVLCKLAASGEEAVRLLQLPDSEPFDIIFIDYKINNKSGLEIAAAQKGCETPPVFVLMAMSEMLGIMENAATSGIQYFLQKPVLETTICKLLKNMWNTSGEYITPDPTEKPDYSGKNFLVVEDNEINREIIRFILEDTNANIFEAENGRQAWEKYQAEPKRFDLIFMDIQMPIMDGYTTAQKIRGSGLEDCTKIPIVAMTANVFKADVEKALSVGMNAHVGKPINAQDVYEAANQFLF